MSQMIVNCVSYADGKRMGSVDLEDISEILRFEGQFIWIGLHEPDEDLLRKIQEEFGLHDLAVEDAHRAHQRPKIEEYGDSLFVVLRTAQTLPGSCEVVFGETHAFLGQRYVVTIRHGASLSYAEVRQGEAFLVGCHISPYTPATLFNQPPMRKRKLLLHKKEIAHLIGKSHEEGLTMLNLPILRWGTPYTSLEQDEVVHFLSGSFKIFLKTREERSLKMFCTRWFGMGYLNLI